LKKGVLPVDFGGCGCLDILILVRVILSTVIARCRLARLSGPFQQESIELERKTFGFCRGLAYSILSSAESPDCLAALTNRVAEKANAVTADSLKHRCRLCGDEFPVTCLNFRETPFLISCSPCRVERSYRI
jgi:hypothetical protein